MAYNTLENATDLGIRGILNFPNVDTPSFYPIMLFVFFFIFTTLTFFREVKREGRANLLSSLAVGGFVTTALAGVLSLLQVVSNVTVITVLVLSIVFETIYLLTKP